MALTKTFSRVRGDEFQAVADLLADTGPYPDSV